MVDGEEPPRHRKRAKRRRVRSDHRHEYETVCIDIRAWMVSGNRRHAFTYFGKRCRTCGRLADAWCDRDVHEPPRDMRLFEVKDFGEFLEMTELPDSYEIRRA